MITKKISIALLFTATFTGTLLPSAISAQSKAVSPVAPRREQVEAVVKEAYEKFKGDTGGKNADYIPYLAQVDSKMFGIAIVTTDNQVLTMGDVDYSFSIQSISKVFTLALAMDELGADDRIPKNRIRTYRARVQLAHCGGGHANHTGNPFVNAGAIATTSLISGATQMKSGTRFLTSTARRPETS